MPPTRHFLGWDEPMLPQAARWLHERYGPAMGQVHVVLPAGRAKRRLLELLVEATSGGGFEPPALLTVGELPEVLYDRSDDVADPLTALVTRMHALRTADPAVLNPVVPHAPAKGDVAGWWGVAETLAGLSEELAAARLRVNDVHRIAAEHGFDLGLSGARWAALVELEARYHRALGRPDVQVARLNAIRDGACRCEAPLVLIGVVDPSRQLAAMLGQVQGPVEVLVQAPEKHAAGFDALGGVVADYWKDQAVEVADLRLTDRPSDEAVAVVRCLGELKDAAADAVTVGLGDEARAGGIQRAIELAGTPARYGGGSPTPRSRPARLLDALSGYFGAGRFTDLATVVRHPDLTAYLGDDTDWLTMLDRHATRFMQADTEGPWQGDERTRRRLDDLRDRLDTLAPADPTRPRALPRWSEAILMMLTEVYGRLTLDRQRDHAVIAALTQITEVLREQAALNEAHEATPRVTLAEALRLTGRRLAGLSIPEPGGTVAVELVGFLELALDDAPHLIITGLNEGHIPASRNADAFLPDALRSVLGMPDNARRYARDALLLSTILRGRASVTLTTTRRSAEDEPLAPSRLLLACDEDTLAARLEAFYRSDEGEPRQATPMLLQPGGVNRFVIPRPVLDVEPITRLSVTKFKSYLTCRYRFYLSHVLGLEALDDRAVELDALAFGNVAHTVLERFAKSEDADATDAALIERTLDGLLDEVVAERLGRQSRVAVRVQVEQLRERLRRFADQQALEAQKGWRICRDRIEQKYEATVEVDGEPFVITGRIDRIDHHPQLGYRLLDYKTSDGGDEPDKTHRSRGEWVDLQLPLYRGLVGPTGIEGAALGYINLAKSAEKTGLKMAFWNDEELVEAEAVRDDVIRGLRAQRFWPPNKDLPRWDDAFVRIAADKAIDREQLIGGEA